MKGTVDDELRALLEVDLFSEPDGNNTILLAWIDTAFNGGLVLPQSEIVRLGLKPYSSTSAILANGEQVELATYTCYIDWFGKLYRTQVVANEGTHPLLGTQLLDGHDLHVSYKGRTVTLD